MGNQHGKQPYSYHGGKPKKFVHWKTAERPSPPGRPLLIPLSTEQPDVIKLKWDRPQSDGGSVIIGYIVEHRRMGSPHWVRATPALVKLCEVSISGLEPGWRYQFRAIAENIVGKSDPSELSDSLTVTLQRNAISVPRFISELKDKNAVENDRVEMRVAISGQPQPEVSWFKDGFEIFSSRRTKILYENDVSVLIIHQVALTDEGEIKCTATNRAGYVATKARLKVEAPPKIRLPRNYEDGLIVEADEVLRLKVGIAGQPIPTVIWSHEGFMIKNNERFELITNDKNSSLKIDNVKREDRGEYHLRAVNSLGEDIASFLVTVTAKPNPPGKVKLNMSFGKSATLSWIAPSDDGGCKIGNYIVEYYRIGWDVWLKAATTRQLTATLHDLIEGSEYKFRVKAENPYGLSEPSEESDVLFIPDPKRGLTKPEEKEIVTLPEKPLSPKRKRPSPLKFLNVSNKSPSGSRELSPNRQNSPGNKPELFESEQLHREMSYGTPNEIVNENIKKSSSGSKIEQNYEKRSSLSPPSIEDGGSAKSSPSLSRRGSFKLEVTQKIQQFFKRSPSPGRKILSAPTEGDPKKESQKEESPIKTGNISPGETLSKSPLLTRNSQINSNNILKEETNKNSLQSNQKTDDIITHRVPSPFPRKKDLSPSDKQKSPALKRSEERVDVVENFADYKISGAQNFNHTSPPQSPVQLRLNGNILDDKSLKNSNSPIKDLQVPSDTEKRDEVHTSNEFMLVLYSDKKSKKTEKNESFDLDLEDALSPPPLSLSAPDLMASYDQYLFPMQIRRSVSSTEMLYERAMARFYEAVEMEESETFKNQLMNKDSHFSGLHTTRKKLGAMSEAERLSFERRSSRRRSADLSQEFTLPNKWDSKENLAMLSVKNTIERNINRNENEVTSKQKDLNIEIYSKPDLDEELEFNSDYTESTASDSEESMEKFKNELIARTRSTSGELETYHPRRLSEGSFSPYRSPTPDQASIVLTRPHPLPSPDFIPKPILKRPSNENVVKEDSGSDTNRGNNGDKSFANQKHQINLKDQKKIEEIVMNPEVSTKPSKKQQIKLDEKKGKGLKSFFKWDNTKDKNDSKSNASDKKEKTALHKAKDSARQKSLEEAEKKKIDQTIAAEEDKVVIDHYSNIVKELGRNKISNISLYAKKSGENLEDKLSNDEIDPEEADSISRAISRPRMSIVERIQTQHVQVKSKSAFEASNNDTQPDSFDKEKSADESISKTKKPLRTVKVKKVKKLTLDSSENSEENLISSPTSVEIERTKVGQQSETPAVKRRQLSKTRNRVESQSPVTLRRKPIMKNHNYTPDKSNEIDVKAEENNQLELPKQISPEEIADIAQENVRSAVSYVIDLGLFIIACWVYIFKDARLVLPILSLMVYRQIGEAISNQIPDWMKRKKN